MRKKTAALCAALFTALLLLSGCSGGAGGGTFGGEEKAANVKDASSATGQDAADMGWDFAVAGPAAKEGGALETLAHSAGLGQKAAADPLFQVVTAGAEPPVLEDGKRLVAVSSEAGKAVKAVKASAVKKVIPFVLEGYLDGEWTLYADYTDPGIPLFTSAEVSSISGQAPADYLKEHAVALPGLSNAWVIAPPEDDPARFEVSGKTTVYGASATLYTEEGGEEAEIKVTDKEGPDGTLEADTSALSPGTWAVDNGLRGRGLFTVPEGGAQ